MGASSVYNQCNTALREDLIDPSGRSVRFDTIPDDLLSIDHLLDDIESSVIVSR
jgi:hypothetical protein